MPTIILVLWVTSLILGDQRVQDAARQIERVAPKNLGAGLRHAFDELSPTRERELRGLKGRALLFIVLLPVFVMLGLYLALGANFRVSSGLAAIVLFAVWLFLLNVMVLVGYTFARET